MWVGAARIVLDFYGNDNVTVKHRKIEELCDIIRRKFNISALEVADFEDPERCVLGFTMVFPETWKESSAREIMEKVCKTIDETAFARVMVEDWDLLTHGQDD